LSRGLHIPHTARSGQIQAEWIGCRVKLGTHAQVHSVYRKACNLITDQGTLVTLLASDQGHLPNGICCSSATPADWRAVIAPNLKVAIEGGLLEIDEGRVTIDLSAAKTWDGTLAGVDVCSSATRRSLAYIWLIAFASAPAVGFASLLRSATPSCPLDRAMQSRLASTLPDLMDATQTFDATAVAHSLSRLVGLGPGLTPSGDDFIVGYLAALHSRRSWEPCISALLDRLTPSVERLAGGTNIIARHFVLDALAGAFSERLSNLFRALSQHDEAKMRCAVAELLEVGHSSGADALVGMTFGLAPALVFGRGHDSRAFAELH
jgi:hypothetical protein